MGKPDVKTYISYTDKVRNFHLLMHVYFTLITVDLVLFYQAATANQIDATSNLADDKIFMFSGNADSTVNVSFYSIAQKQTPNNYL